MSYLTSSRISFARSARAENTPEEALIFEFARALRDAGLPADLETMGDAVHAVDVVRPASFDDLFWVLHAVFVKRYEHHMLFRGIFDRFWLRR